MKVKLVIILCFAFAFGAGLVVGLQLKQPIEQAGRMPDRSGRPLRDRSWLSRELGLDAKLDEQIRKIWQETMHASFQEHEARRKEIRQERDGAIDALLVRPEDKNMYEVILQEYSRKTKELEKGRGKAFETAVARTKELLTPAQVEKYEALLKRHEGGPPPGFGPGPGPGPDGGGPPNRRHNRRGDDHAASRPGAEK